MLLDNINIVCYYKMNNSSEKHVFKLYMIYFVYSEFLYTPQHHIVITKYPYITKIMKKEKKEKFQE